MKAESPAGPTEFQRSLSPRGMSASLTSGLPSRDTCTHGPVAVLTPPGLRTSAIWRLAEAHTPMTASARWCRSGSSPLAVRSEIGTWMAMEWTL